MNAHKMNAQVNCTKQLSGVCYNTNGKKKKKNYTFAISFTFNKVKPSGEYIMKDLLSLFLIDFKRRILLLYFPLSPLLYPICLTHFSKTGRHMLKEHPYDIRSQVNTYLLKHSKQIINLSDHFFFHF